jgi:Protein of unknown function (DUF4246)
MDYDDEDCAPASDSLYATPCAVAPKTLLEQDIDRFTSALREKPDWQIKCQDPDIVSKWNAEALAQRLSQAEFDFAMQVRRTWAARGPSVRWPDCRL